MEMLDYVIKGGLIADGSGSPSWVGDVGIRDGKIIKLCGNIGDTAGEIIDAAGRVVAPGFIDLHSHSDFRLLEEPAGEIKLRQGVTTEIFGNCGFSAAPLSERHMPLLLAYSEPVMGQPKEKCGWRTYGEYLSRLSRSKLGHNTGGYVGNGALRIAVKGFEAGPLTGSEMAEVKRLLRESLEAGALGLSLGLMYVPENYYDRDELAEICSVVKEYGAIVTAHIRGEGNSLGRSIEEVLYIAEKSGVPLHISHFKAAGKNNWGEKCDAAIGRIEAARSRGVDVTCDVYPYTAGSTTLTSLLPPWSMEGGIEKTLQRIRDPETRLRICDELSRETDDWDNLVYSTGWESVLVSSVNTAANRRLVGKNILEIAQLRQERPIDAFLDLLAEEAGKVAIVIYHMSEDDVIKILKLGFSFVISDSLYSSGGLPHPRLYGTFPRLFARYVREKKVLSLEEAVKKVTSMPAKRLGLESIGRLECGMNADIVVFDAGEINDRATYIDPKQFPAGIEQVLVGGKVAVKSGELTGVRNGRLLLKGR